MSSLLMVNPHRRKKQSYLLNPANPFETLKYPARKLKIKFSSKTGRFQKADTKKNPIAKKAKHRKVKKTVWTAAKRSAFARKMALARSHKHGGTKKISHRKHAKRTACKVTKSRKAISEMLMAPMASLKPARLFGPGGQLINSKGGHTMARRRKSHRKSTRRNPLGSIKNMAKGFINTELLIDGSLVAGGMIVSKIAVDFASSKVAFIATPMGKMITRVGLGLGVLASGKFIGKRYSQPLALGFIAPAVVDLIAMVVPANLLPAGGVQLLEAGYMPDVARGTVSLEQGYMPDVQEGSFGFSD